MKSDKSKIFDTFLQKQQKLTSCRIWWPEGLIYAGEKFWKFKMFPKPTEIVEFWLEMNVKHNFTQPNLIILKICHFFTIFSQNTMTFNRLNLSKKLSNG